MKNSTVIKKPKSKATHIEKEDLETILEGAKTFSAGDYMQKHRCTIQKCLYPVILTAYHTGMRINEVLGLRWGNIDLENNMIIVKDPITENVIYTEMVNNQSPLSQAIWKDNE